MDKIDLFKILCDGRFHSGTALGEQLQCSRSAIWKAIKLLKQQFNVTIFSVPGRGYSLQSSIELLESHLITQSLSDNSQKVVKNLEVFFSINSTNEYLVAQTKLHKYNNSVCQVCLAEYQTNGKGRRGKSWFSPLGGNIYCSLSWNFNKSFQELAGLSIAISVGIAGLLEQLGVSGVELKWPNDILWRGRKVIGVLLEMHGETSGPCTAIIGIGLNYDMAKSTSEIDQPWCDLNSILSALPARNTVCAQLINNLIGTIETFEKQGLDAFLESWNNYDVIRDKTIDIKKAESTEIAIARGIDDTGALLVEQNGCVTALYSGDVSVRLNELNPV